jgi:DNA-binding transcriptional LysR family regulator
MTRIPPIHCLLTFEALARLHNATKAADELNVTPSAVSHRIRQLESMLGTKLFERADFGLTPDGVEYLVSVREGLLALQRLPGRVPELGPTKLRLSVTPTFSRQILLPKLALFRHAYPDVELTMQVTIPLFDVKGEECDLEIRYGASPYADVEYERILADTIYPACSPEYLNEAGPFDQFESIESVSRARLVRSPLEPWSTWFKACDIALSEPRGGAQFNDIGLMLDAAVSGFGVTLLRHKLGAAWIESGRLVRLSQREVLSPHSHYICWKPGALERWECAAFVDWIKNMLAQ